MPTPPPTPAPMYTTGDWSPPPFSASGVPAIHVHNNASNIKLRINLGDATHSAENLSLVQLSLVQYHQLSV